MPKPKKKSIHQANAEFQRKEFPARVAAAKKAATAALAADKAIGKGHKGLTREERGSHQRVLKAVGRIEGRMKGPAPSSKDVTNPGKKGKKKTRSTPASRRRPLEKATGVGPNITDRLRGINSLIAAGKKKGG